MTFYFAEYQNCGYRVSSENDIAPGIAKLAHRQQGLSGKGWDNMTMACSSWEPR